VVSGGARAVARCDSLGASPYSNAPDMLYRGYLTPALARTHEAVGAWMAEAGMNVALDAAANLIGRYEGREADARALLIGSHLDSVRDGGRYDGPLGVMLGIECVSALKDAGRRMRFPIEVIGFGDEEGSRFPSAMLTSQAVAGTLDPAALEVEDAEGIALADALRGFGPAPSVSRRPLRLQDYLAAARKPGTTRAYLEAHIEQGPALEAEGLPLGIVTGIASQLRYRVTITGVAGHAGTTSMPLRRDALAAAAEMVLAVERIARAPASDLVATVGRIEAAPGAPNVIPGRVVFSIDVRAGDAERRDRAAETILAECTRIAAVRGVEHEASRVHDLPASPCDAELMDMLEAAVAATGTPPRRLVSGAGHDAMVMAALCPTAMLFVRCKDGISHNPAEEVDPGDVELALRAMLGFIDRLEAADGA
jgi:allantoate deiminase